jgi:dihydrolipoamide dehydrogenase
LIILIHSFRLLGTHIIGPRTEERIPEAVLAVEFGANPEGIAGTAHSHPTFAETFMEAAAAVRRLGVGWTQRQRRRLLGATLAGRGKTYV